MAILTFATLALSALPLTLALPGPGPAPTPAPRPLLKRDTCNGDNCLNALRGNSASATTFCDYYTQTLSPTSTPTYVPSTCGSARLSSACYCLGVPTYTATACPTGQAVHNPSFYGKPPGQKAVDIAPWVLAHSSGSGGCYPVGSYSEAYMDLNWGDPRSVGCKYDPATGGADTISQDLTLCPNTQYTFTAHTACDWQVYPNAPVGVKFRVTFNGAVIVPWQYACAPCSNPNGCTYPRYQTVTGTVTSPTTGKGTLKFDVAGDTGLTAQAAPFLLDQIFLQPPGSSDFSNPDV